MSSEGAVQNKPNGVGSTSVLRQGVGEEQRTRGNPNGPPSDTTNDFHVAEHYAKENYAKNMQKAKRWRQSRLVPLSHPVQMIVVVILVIGYILGIISFIYFKII